MLCNKCEKTLPDDSTFCQFCGSKIVPATAEETSTMSKEEALAKVIATGVVEGHKAVEANKTAQPQNEADSQFGLVPEKPIYTAGIDKQEHYLKSLRTPTGEPIKWSRRGSMSVNGVHGIIDVFDIYLQSGAEYKTIYINMYGAKNSTMAPQGFTLKTNQTIQKNKVSFGNVFKAKNDATSKSNKLLTFSIIATIILSIISVLCVILAMIFQDPRRATEEYWNTTVVYAVLFIVIGTLLGFSIRSLKTKKLYITFLSSLVALTVVCIVIYEASVLQSTYVANGKIFWYDNRELIEVLNSGWILGTIFSFSICLLSMLIAFARKIIKKISDNWHSSITYRERCYKRVEKLHLYLEKGIITQAEYERTKKDILKNITNISE